MELYIKQKFWSVLENYSILDEHDTVQYLVRSEWTFFHKKFIISDPQGNPILTVVSRISFIFAKFDIAEGYIAENKASNPIARFKEGFHMPLRRRGYLKYVDENGVEHKLRITGSFIGFNWKIKDKSLPKEERLIAKVNKKVFKIADTYKVEILNESVPKHYLLIIGLLIDTLHHQKH